MTVTNPDIAAFKEVLVPVQADLIGELGLEAAHDALNGKL